MRVVVDNNLPWLLARKLSTPQLPVEHVHDLGWQHLSDHELKRKFSGESVAWISRDGDFWREAPAGWAVVWIACHNPRLSFLLGEVVTLLRQHLSQLQPGSRFLFSDDEMIHFSPHP